MWKISERGDDIICVSVTALAAYLRIENNNYYPIAQTSANLFI